MKKRIIATLIIPVFFISGCGVAASGSDVNNVSSDTYTEETMEAASYKQITQTEAMDMMSKESDFIILDVRTEAEYAGGHIPDAICIPNETINNNIIEKLPDKEQIILVYCRSGNRSKQASEKLASMGYTNVYEFGGINTWTGETVK